jgi:manganese/zinc/iron transport system permease protein
MHRLLLIGALLGLISGVSGAFFSFLGTNLPTGPFMVLSASGLFVLAFFLSPSRGLVPRWWRSRGQRVRIARENTLKAVYQILEDEAFRRDSISLRELAEKRRVTLEAAGGEARSLRRAEFATLDDETVCLTPSGWQRAAAIVRNHRLWELYLTHAAQMAPDHVHDDAEKIEHVLGEDAVRQLERRLQFADTDPHGKPIPGVHAVHGPLPVARPGKPTGYGGNR